MFKRKQKKTVLNVESSSQPKESKLGQDKETYFIQFKDGKHQVVNRLNNEVVFESEILQAADTARAELERKAIEDGQNFMPINETPFYAGKTKNGKWSIGCGKTKHFKDFETMEEAIQYVKDQNMDWALITMCCEMIHNILKNKK